jgi:hypothetical protein
MIEQVEVSSWSYKVVPSRLSSSFCVRLRKVVQGLCDIPIM